MSANVKIQLIRGLKTNLPTTFGAAGVLAWTTDSNELFIDTGTALQTLANNIAVFTAASQSAMIALAAKIGDHCDRTDLKQIFILTAFPASTVGNWTAVSPDSSITGIAGLSSGTTHEWVSYIDSSGVQHLTQPTFSDLSGTATANQVPSLSSLNGAVTQLQLPTTIGSGSNLTSIDCGTF